MRMFRKLAPGLLSFALLLLGLSHAASAQDDPPGRVARVNFIKGNVSFLPSGGGDDDWITAVQNRPMTTGDRIWVDKDARAEIHIGSTAIRLDQSTGVSFISLTDDSVQVQLTEGSMDVHLRSLNPNETYEVDTPNLAFSLQSAGVYRIDENADGNQTVVTDRQGQGEVTGGGRSYPIKADQQASFSGTDTLQYDLADADAQPLSDFDTWAADLDRRENSSASAAYVSPDTTGYEDLDTYGTWTSAPDYGNVWVPTGVAVGWAPYRNGHWVWVAPWGWTWVDDAPWGFAPFHYGRWAFWGNRWVWVPGPLGPRPYYAPALVAWVGGGPGIGFSASFGIGGGVAWFPLGPREVFVPSYHVSAVYVTRVNITNTVVDRTTVINTYNNVNVRNVTYVNQRVAGGVTAVPHDVFVKGQSVAHNNIQVSQRDAIAAPVVRQLQVAPQKESIVGAARPAVVRPPATMLNRSVMATPRAIQKISPPQQQGGQPPSNLRPGGAPFPGNTGNPPNRTGVDQAPPPARGGFQPLPQQPPVVKPAPPVRPPTPQEKVNEDSKQKSWEDAHPRPPVKQPPPPPPPKKEPPKKDNKSGGHEL